MAVQCATDSASHAKRVIVRKEGKKERKNTASIDVAELMVIVVDVDVIVVSVVALVLYPCPCTFVVVV